MSIKIGAVSYLNTKPLVYGLDASNAEYELSYQLPSQLADMLARGELDIALIPAYELFLRSDYKVVSDACIGCLGPVKSVKLISHVPFEKITSVAMDVGSRTSVVLAKILLHRRFNIEPIEFGLPIDSDWKSAPADAVMIIGDRAMQPDFAPFKYAWDLGEEWNKEAGLPFVFAAWVARQDLETHTISEQLSLSRDLGLKNLAEIAHSEATHYPLSENECLDYLQNKLHFNLGTSQRAGLKLFQQWAYELDLLPAINDIQYQDLLLQKQAAPQKQATAQKQATEQQAKLKVE